VRDRICALFIDLDHMIIPDVFTVAGPVGVLLSLLLPSLHGQGADIFASRACVRPGCLARLCVVRRRAVDRAWPSHPEKRAMVSRREISGRARHLCRLEGRGVRMFGARCSAASGSSPRCSGKNHGPRLPVAPPPKTPEASRRNSLRRARPSAMLGVAALIYFFGPTAGDAIRELSACSEFPAGGWNFGALPRCDPAHQPQQVGHRRLARLAALGDELVGRNTSSGNNRILPFISCSVWGLAP